MYVKACVVIGLIILVIIAINILRRNINGRRVSDDSDSIDGIQKRNRESEAINSGLAANAGARREATRKISENNSNAGSGIDDALGILKKAKDRNNP